MPKSSEQIDVLVLGEHPATYLAAILLADDAKLHVLHATIPDGQNQGDRLVIINPSLFGLHPHLAGLSTKIDMSPVHALRLLSDDVAVHSRHESKSMIVHVAKYKDVRAAMKKIATDKNVECIDPKSLAIHRLDETGADVTIGKNAMRASMLMVGGNLSAEQQRAIGTIDPWDKDILHRVTMIKIKSAKWLADAKMDSTICMSLDLRGTLWWAWLLAHKGELQLSVAQPIASVAKFSPQDLLGVWIDVLQRHKILNGGAVPISDATSSDLPLGGALMHEGICNRTLLIGPAGGFYSACAEDIYPNCWSTLFAVETAKKALNEKFLQDALSDYREKWRTTLGDYLRGPQQNLRFLLPLVYRNSTMTSRLADAILLGKSIVQEER